MICDRILPENGLILAMCLLVFSPKNVRLLKNYSPPFMRKSLFLNTVSYLFHLHCRLDSSSFI